LRHRAAAALVWELVAAFEQETGKTVELVRHDIDEQTAAVQAAIDADPPPDFLFGQLAEHLIPRWVEEGRLVDLSEALGALKDQFEIDALEFSVDALEAAPHVRTVIWVRS
jgi:maltose-binding protein MalE